MQGWYPAAFEREMGCTEADWLRCLPGAVGAQGARVETGSARVAIDAGELRLSWAALPERRIALVRLPRLGVRFVFEGVDESARQRFMRYFDLYMQRGGG